MCESCDKQVSIKEEEVKERKTMFNNTFGKVRGNALALSYDGKIAVSNNNDDYVRYNAETSTVENIKKFVINDSKWFFIIPAAEVEAGDIIKYNDGYFQAIKNNEDGISAINLMNSTMTTIVKETIFGMSCYAKVISLIDSNTFGAQNSGNNMMMMFMMMEDDEMDMKELMMMQMLANNGGKTDGVNPMMLALMMDDDDEDNDTLTNIMMMQAMTGGQQMNMGNMMNNPLMLMMLMKDKNGRGGDNKFMKFMLMSQFMNQNNQQTTKTEE
jgi:hypothetical protein